MENNFIRVFWHIKKEKINNRQATFRTNDEAVEFMQQLIKENMTYSTGNVIDSIRYVKTIW